MGKGVFSLTADKPSLGQIARPTRCCGLYQCTKCRWRSWNLIQMRRLELATGFAAHFSVAPMHPVVGEPNQRLDFYLRNWMNENQLLVISLIEANWPNLAESTAKRLGWVRIGHLVQSEVPCKSLTVEGVGRQLDDSSSVAWNLPRPIHPDSCWMRWMWSAREGPSPVVDSGVPLNCTCHSG